MDSSIIGELVELADTALEESWNSPNDKNKICERANGGNICPVNIEHKLEIAGPAPTMARVKLERRQLEPPSNNNCETVVQIHQQTRSQIEEVQAYEFIDIRRSCSTPLQGIIKAPWEWPTIIEQDSRPLREANMGVPGFEKGTKGSQEKAAREENPPKFPPTRKWEKWADQITS
ncbi:hypothetical protein NDU88_002798 [Pleurodeles waltl]|uniref:Uncharacterized protein n=1 Tax=Pleurodeles waltl TaxID=8319 RepID=A0AAV7LF46_PLEWA|nr:hypothetical protein NDU88_002798 [Pleurodeles waltl]